MSGCPTGSEVGIAWLATLSVIDSLSFSKLNVYIYILGVNRRLAEVQGPWFQERPCQRQDSQNGKSSLMKSDTISGLS